MQVFVSGSEFGESAGSPHSHLALLILKVVDSVHLGVQLLLLLLHDGFRPLELTHLIVNFFPHLLTYPFLLLDLIFQFYTFFFFFCELALVLGKQPLVFLVLI